MPRRGTRATRRAEFGNRGSAAHLRPRCCPGFIQPDGGGKDVFVHVSAVQAAGLDGLNDGQKVSCEVVTERGKQAAANLKVG